MKELQHAREAINDIDRQMAKLFSQRMEAVKAVAEYKRERGLPVLDAQREQAVVERNSALVADSEIRSYYVGFIQNAMLLSRQYQHRLMEGLKVAYSGVEGAFAYIAAKRIFPEGQLVSCADFQAAYDAVTNGDCDCGVLPIENSYAGEVGQVLDLMFRGSLYVSGVYTLRITQNLLGVPGASLADVRQAVSHPQALSQCEGYLRKHGIGTIAETNTAMAAKRVAALGDPSVAAVASAETAALYGLEILDHDINESALNSTRFAVFSRAENRDHSNRDEGKFLLFFTVRNVAGALAKAINVIGEYGFNMKVLRSRPMRELAWQHYFYIEAEGDETSENGRAMLAQLAAHCDMLKVVGHYSMEVDLKGSDEA